mmetsp:Transcript_8540/g.14486  ORF Transcript_8540/g.14486 Transcript_8540/m.14486 type:complete len:135 (-) Transcript_8540:256-660(-)
MSSTESDERVENESSKILGIGGGTFTVFFLAMIVCLVWVLTAPLKFGPLKRLTRLFSLLTFIVIFLILLLSDREDQYQGEGEKIEAHDSYIVPRIAVSSMMILSAIMSVTFMVFIHCSKVITGSSQEIDETSLW